MPVDLGEIASDNACYGLAFDGQRIWAPTNGMTIHLYDVIDRASAGTLVIVSTPITAAKYPIFDGNRVWVQCEDVSGSMSWAGVNAATVAIGGASTAETGLITFSASSAGEAGLSEFAYFGRPCFDGDAIWFPMCNKYVLAYTLCPYIRRIPRSGTR
jgi:hypothetical protein